MGVAVALDDFGTGFASIGYLQSYGFDCVKLDRTLSAGLGRDRRAAMLVSGMIQMARGLDMRVAAEGWRASCRPACCGWPGAMCCRVSFRRPAPWAVLLERGMSEPGSGELRKERCEGLPLALPDRLPTKVQRHPTLAPNLTAPQAEITPLRGSLRATMRHNQRFVGRRNGGAGRWPPASSFNLARRTIAHTLSRFPLRARIFRIGPLFSGAASAMSFPNRRSWRPFPGVLCLCKTDEIDAFFDPSPAIADPCRQGL
jgi:hypothetical protein